MKVCNKGGCRQKGDERKAFGHERLPEKINTPQVRPRPCLPMEAGFSLA